MSVATFKMGFYPLYLKSYEKFTFFNVSHFGLQIAALIGTFLIVLKSAYPNYPINQCHALIIHLNNPIIYVL